MRRQRAAQVQRGAAVTFSDYRRLDAGNCSLQLTGDLLQDTCHARESEILITKVRKIST